MRFKGPKKLVGIGGFNWYGGTSSPCWVHWKNMPRERKQAKNLLIDELPLAEKYA